MKETLARLLSVDNVAIPLPGYALSWIELVGTLLCLWSVWLIAARRTLSWPVGVASAVLYCWLFYQIRLYADVLEQAYFFLSGLYGWWQWASPPAADADGRGFGFGSRRLLAAVAAGTAVASLALGRFLSEVHLLWPALFPEPAAFPYLDAGTTAASFAAQALMALKRTECWVYWIAVDIVGIGLYAAKGVYFVAGLYVVLLILAVGGLRRWLRPAA